MFTDDDDNDNDFEYTDRLEYSYKGKTFSGQETFESLHYRRYNIDRIIIKVRKLIEKKEDNKKETDIIAMDVKNLYKVKRNIPYLFKEPESDYKFRITVNSDQTINDVIEKIKEQAKIYFDFEFVPSNELTDDLNNLLLLKSAAYNLLVKGQVCLLREDMKILAGKVKSQQE